VEDYASKTHRHLDTEAELQRLRDQVARLRRELDGVLDYVENQKLGSARAAERIRFMEDT
jgi:predicted dithiol-disulfide oxidoreductase (DUF899 family)